MIECPQCGSDHVLIAEFDYGVDGDGYHNCGVRFKCLDCKEEGDYETTQMR